MVASLPLAASISWSSSGCFRVHRAVFFRHFVYQMAQRWGLPSGAVVKMTAKTWCAISKAVEMIKTAQNTNVGIAQAWLIEACSAGNIRSRHLSATAANRDGIVGMNARPGSRFEIISRKRAPRPVLPALWKGAVIGGDVLVTSRGRWSDIEISIADLEFHLKQSLPLAGTGAAVPIPSVGRPSDKEAIIAEAQRRVAADESIPPTLSAFARELHFKGSPGFFATPKLGRLLAPRRSRSTFGLFGESIEANKRCLRPRPSRMGPTFSVIEAP
jgi:hypothetical protein